MPAGETKHIIIITAYGGSYMISSAGVPEVLTFHRTPAVFGTAVKNDLNYPITYAGICQVLFFKL